MRFLLVILLGSLSSFSSIASNLESIFESEAMNLVCQKTARFTSRGSLEMLKVVNADEKFIYFALRGANNGELLIVNQADMSQKSIKFENKIQNIQIVNEEILLLTTNELFVINKNDHSLILKTPTLPLGMSSARYSRPYGVYKYKNIYYIAHGKFGIIPFDSTQMKHLPAIIPVAPQPIPQMISIVTDIVGINEEVYLGFDNLSLHSSKRAFEGVMIFNLETMQEERSIPLKKEAYHMPNLTIDNEELVVSNFNLNFRHKLSSLKRDKYMKPVKRIWKYPLGSLIGRGIIKDKKIYGCFKNRSQKLISSGWMSLE